MYNNIPTNPRFTIIETLFMNYKKNPQKEQWLFDRILQDTADIPADVLTKAITTITKTNTFFPNIQEILTHCELEAPRKIYESVECQLCGGVGYVFECKGINSDKTRFTVGGIEHKPKDDVHYASNIVGRCTCLNGEIFEKRLPVAEPLRFIQEISRERNFDCPFISQELAKSLNRKKLGKKPPQENPKLAKLIQSIVERIEVETE